MTKNWPWQPEGLGVDSFTFFCQPHEFRRKRDFYGAFLHVSRLYPDNTLQDLVLTLHHALTITFAHTGAVKIIENHKGVAYVQQVQLVKGG